MKCDNLIGLRFGKLVVIDKEPSDKNGHSKWLCKCDCGESKVVSGTNLKTGKIVSCGCYHAEMASERAACGDACVVKTHGKSKTRLHEIWSGMRKRCTNPNCKSYPLYGGRGISVCEEWDDF